MSNVRFVGPDQWRHRGRPKTVASQEVIDAVAATSPDGPVGKVPLDSGPGTAGRSAEVAEYRRELYAAGRVLGVEVKTQIQENALLFYQQRRTAGEAQ